MAPRIQTDHGITIDAPPFPGLSRWVTEPWWFAAAGWLGVVPADFLDEALPPAG